VSTSDLLACAAFVPVFALVDSGEGPFARRPGDTGDVSASTMQVFTALLALFAAIGSLALVFARLVSTRVPAADRIVTAVHGASTWLAALVAAVATAGSLWFSEVADYVPCRLCWFQRICMYPLVAVLVVGAWRRDRVVRWYALPMLVAGTTVSAYHSLIEWKPWLDSGSCGAGPSCTDVWFRRFGFLTLAVMALIGFVTIAVLLFVTPTRRNPDGTGDDWSDGMRPMVVGSRAEVRDGD